MSFSFEKLLVYKKSLEFVDEIEELSKLLKGKIEFSYIDQLKRAVLSIPLNIAEANGRWHKNERKQFYFISRGSVFECVPLIQIIYRKGLISQDRYEKIYSILEEIAKMLSGLIKSTEKLKR
ncbi:MAG: four helix bundle protein [Candidatus Helarchaeota archaeon]|nr:four helix bundle protein [Candidatus Helarchaeota archaeon]